MFYYCNIYICRSYPYFWVCNLGIPNTHAFSANGILELTENIIQYAYGHMDTRVDREHYSIRIWPECDNLHPGSHNII